MKFSKLLIIKYLFLLMGGWFCFAMVVQAHDQHPFYEVRIYKGSGFQMTNLMRDSLFFQNDTIVIDESPLLEIETLSSELFQNEKTFLESAKENGYSTGFNVHHGDRGYIACWKIKGNKLYLRDIRPNVVISQPEIGVDVFRKRAQRAIGKSFDRSGLIFANWFSGTIVGGIDGKSDHHGIAGDFRKKVIFQVKNGVVQDFTISKVEKSNKGQFEYLLPSDSIPKRLPYYFYRIYPSGLAATNLMRDELYYLQDTIYINESPILDLEEVVGLSNPSIEPKPLIFFEGNSFKLDSYVNHQDRGFKAYWKIDGNRLYLVNVNLAFDHLSSSLGDRDTCYIRFIESLEKASGEKFVDDWLFARWFTGCIVGGMDGESGYRFSSGIWGNFKREAIITVKNGIVENVEIKLVEHRESRLFQYRLPDE